MIKIDGLRVDMEMYSNDDIEEKIFIMIGNTEISIDEIKIKKDFSDRSHSINDDIMDDEEVDPDEGENHFSDLKSEVEEKDMRMFNNSYTFAIKLRELRAKEMVRFLQEIEDDFKMKSSNYAHISDNEKINYCDNLERLKTAFEEYDPYAYGIAKILLAKDPIEDLAKSLKLEIIGLKS